MDWIALDGHDGAGKTQIAKALAHASGYTYRKPFHGELGDRIARAWKEERYELASRLALEALNATLSLPPADRLILDRCWVTMFTVLPRRLWADWPVHIKTVVCWTDLPTTLARIQSRGELILEEDRHDFFIGKYREIASEFNLLVHDTTHTSIEESVAHLARLLNLDSLPNLVP